MPGPRTQQDQRPQRRDEPKTKYTDLEDGGLSGNMTRDPELRFTPEGRAVATLRVAETLRVKDPKSDQWGDGPTSFYDVTVWGEQAQNVSEDLQQGDRICVVGKWQKQEWTGDDGTAKEKLVLVARDIGPSLLFKRATVQRDRPKGNNRR